MGYGDATIGGRQVNALLLAVGVIQTIFICTFLFGKGGVQKAIDQVFPGTKTSSKLGMAALHQMFFGVAGLALTTCSLIVYMGIGAHDARTLCFGIARIALGVGLANTVFQLLAGSFVKNPDFKPLKSQVGVNTVFNALVWAQVFVDKVPLSAVGEDLCFILVPFLIMLAGSTKYKKGQWGEGGLLEMDEEAGESDE
jgi:hypothetical protein